jgi:hypothetical protein
VRGTAADPTKFASIPEGQTVTTQAVNGIAYTIKQDIQWVGQSSTQSSCDSPGTGAGQIEQVTATVTWNNMAGTKPVQATTTLAPPVGAFSSSSGSIGVKVLDASGDPAENVAVRIVGPVTDTQESTTQGCAFFAYLTPGTYTASVIDGTGVGDQEDLTPSQQASVTVGQTVSLLFSYDTAATIDATGWSNSTAPAATGIPISVANTGLQPYGQYSFTAGLTSMTPLFPYASGYTVFAGKCTDNNPLGKDNNGNALYPTAAPTPIDVDPGATASTTVDLYTLSVQVKNSSGVAQSGATVTAADKTNYGSPYTVSCTSGTANSAAATVGLANTDTSGNSVAAVPLGHWSITAVKGARRGTVNVWVKPDGVYAVDSTGASTTLYPGAVPVTVS